MASDPNELGDEAAGDELGRVSCMLLKAPRAWLRSRRALESGDQWDSDGG
jgi:hypothetical protein